MKSNGATCAVKMPTLQNSTPWTGPAAPFSHSGARILKNMSPKTRPVKRCSGKDDPQPGFKTGFRGQGSEDYKNSVYRSICRQNKQNYVGKNTQNYGLLVSDSRLLSFDLYSVFPPLPPKSAGLAVYR